MFKKAARFLQSMARKNNARTARRKRIPFKTGLARRLDKEVENAARAPQNAAQNNAGLVKRRNLAGPSE
jgi:hypothetical protein